MNSRNKIKYTRISPPPPPHLTKLKQTYTVEKFQKWTPDLFRRNKFMGTNDCYYGDALALKSI